MNEINQIEESLKTCDEPVAMVSYLTRLAAWNSFYTEQLKKIHLVKPKEWLEIQNFEWVPSGKPDEANPSIEGIKNIKREKSLSDKKTEMTWASTKNGQIEIALTYELKRIDILYRSISKRLNALEIDYRISKSQI